jgi:TIR domain-containing protein
MDRVTRTVLRRNQLKISLLPVPLRQVIELRYDHQNPRDDAQVAQLLKGSVEEIRELTLMAFKRLRELDGVLPVPELEPDEPKRVFVSYSWDDQAHKDWVRQLAEHLQQNGWETQLDQWFMRAGKSAALFMEQGLRQADFILCILTPEYARRANDRDSPSGTGYEQQIITGQILSRFNRHNVIPLLRKGSSQSDRSDCAIPTHMLGTVFVDFTDNARYDKSMGQLLRALHGTPEHKPPPLGLPPSF